MYIFLNIIKWPEKAKPLSYQVISAHIIHLLRVTESVSCFFQQIVLEYLRITEDVCKNCSKAMYKYKDKKFCRLSFCLTMSLKMSFILHSGLHLYRSWWPLIVYSGEMRPGKQRWRLRLQESMCHTERWASDPWCSSGRGPDSSSLLKPAAQMPAVWPLAHGGHGPDKIIQ